jgi:uncharacterized protein
MQQEIYPDPLILDAIDIGDVEELKTLFERFPQSVESSVPGFGNWLIYACQYGSISVIEYLIEMGFNVNETKKNGDQCPLEAATSAGRAEVVSLLIKSGAVSDTHTSLLNPLFGAVIGGSLECAQLILATGIDTSLRYVLGDPNNPSIDALAFALLQGQSDIANLIALQNADGDKDSAQRYLAEGVAAAESICN